MIPTEKNKDGFRFYNQLYSSKNSIASQTKKEQTKKEKKTVMHTDNRYTYCK